MPQLDPMPWFFILMASWTIFLLLAPAKLTKLQHLNDPTPKPHKSSTNSWTWPWP
uniref:ATP synthase complex subunit 8 n=1 Tax=Nyctimystes kubori TaxID=248820 RepID=S4V029_9NEOB|nr:ATP synthase F0 subunit 8 [Nyctimystes kubori]